MQAVQSFLKNHNIHFDKLHKDPRSLVVASAALSLELAKITADVFSKTCLSDTSTAKRVLDFIPIVPPFVTNLVNEAVIEGCGNNKAVLIALALASLASGGATAYVTKNAFFPNQKSATPVKAKASPSAKLEATSKSSPKVTSPSLSPTALLRLFTGANESAIPTSQETSKGKGKGKAREATPFKTKASSSDELEATSKSSPKATSPSLSPTAILRLFTGATESATPTSQETPKGKGKGRAKDATPSSQVTPTFRQRTPSDRYNFRKEVKSPRTPQSIAS